MRFRLAVTVALVGLLLSGSLAPPRAARAEIAPEMSRVWARTDYPVQQTLVNRTWMWGPSVRVERTEPYVEALDGRRAVAYFDKARMEITRPDGDPADPWHVTNGLLVVELTTGQMQLGHQLFEPREPAEVNVAGDPNDPNGPTYRTLGGLRQAPPLADGAPLVQRVDRAGAVWEDPALAEHGAVAAFRVVQPGIDHQVASPFWNFMRSSGLIWDNGLREDRLFLDPFYATGYPISEAYWANVLLAGVPTDVLIQCFERRCLTWTPGNPAGWEVEAGNVGAHYHAWRYDTELPEVLIAPDMRELPEWTSPDGHARHGWDDALAAYVLEDATPVDEGESSAYQVWWAGNPERPADYSVSVDIVTLTDETTPAEAALLYRLDAGEAGPERWIASRIGLDRELIAQYSGPDGNAIVAGNWPVPLETGFGAVNTLAVTVCGDRARVAVNGTVAQHVVLDPRAGVTANGFALAVFRNGPAHGPATRYGFRNLVVREVAPGGCP